MKRLLMIPLLLLCACNGGDEDLTVSGQIEGEAVTAGSRVGGRVETVHVEEGEWVEEGALLVELDAAEAQAAVAAAKAQLARAQAMYDRLVAGATPEQVRQAEAAVAAARQMLNMAETGARRQEKSAASASAEALRPQRDAAREEYERAQRLLAEGAISQRVFEQAEAAYEASASQYQAAIEQSDIVQEGPREEEIAMARADLERAQAVLDEVRAGATAEDLAAARAAIEAAEADLQRAQVALREMRVTAPIRAMVESIEVEPGDLVKPGPVVRLVDPDDLELVIYVGALWLGYLDVGDTARFTTDAHGDEIFTGEIRHIAQQGEFTPRNLQTFEERVQQVFGVTIALDSAGGKLRAGMTATVHLPAPEDIAAEERE